GSKCAASARPRPVGGHCPASDKTARSARTAPTMAQPVPSRPETPPPASSWRNAQTPPSPASTASSPTQCSYPPHCIIHSHWRWVLQRFLNENIKVMRRLWTEDQVSHKGRFYTVNDAGISVKQVRPGGPPLYIAGQADVSVRRAARIGDAWLI